MDIIDLITTQGVAIGCLVAMAKYIVKRDDKHDKENAEMRRTVDNNTKALMELAYYIKGGDRNERPMDKKL